MVPFIQFVVFFLVKLPMTFVYCDGVRRIDSRPNLKYKPLRKEPDTFLFTFTEIDARLDRCSSISPLHSLMCSLNDEHHYRQEL